MTPRARRILRRIVVLLVAPILLGALAVWLLVSTRAGARWAFERIGTLMKGSVRVGAVDGRLASPLTIKDLTYETESLKVTVETLTLRWDLRKLLRKQLDIQSVVADGVVVVSKPATAKEPAKGLTDVHLPVNILVRDAQVKRMRMGEDPKNALLVDSISLATASIGDALRIEKLSIRAPLFDGDFEGTVTPLGDYPVSLDMGWAYRPPGGVAYKGRGTFRGTLAKLEVTESLEAPFQANVTAVFTEPFRELGFDATARFTDVKTRALDPKWPDVLLGGEVKASGRLDALHLEARVNTVSELLQRADIAFDGDYAKNELSIRRLEVTRPGQPTSVTATGTVHVPDGSRPGDPLLFDLDAAWRDLEWPLSGPATFRSRDGKAHAKGTPESYALELTADVSGPEIPEGRWSLRGQGDGKRLRLAAFEGDTLGGRLEGAGDVAWSPEVSWTLSVRGRDLDPATRWPGYDGRLSFELATTGRFAPKGMEAHVDLTHGTGTFRKQDFEASANVDVHGEEIRISTLSLRSGASHLTASGLVGQRTDLTLDLDAPNLTALVPQASGALTAHARVTGRRDEPRVQATVDGKALAFGTQRIRALRARADVDLSKSGLVDLALTAEGIVLSDRSFDSASFSAKGSRAKHSLALSAVSKDSAKPVSLGVELEGGLDPKDAWRGELRKLDLLTKEVGDWRLEGPAAVEATKDSGTLRGFCVASRGGRLCASGSYASGAFDVTGKAEKIPLGLLGPWLPDRVEITGLLDGTFDAKGSPDGTLDAKVDLTPGPGEIRFPEQMGQRKAVGYRDTSLRFVADRTGLRMTAATLLADAGRASFELRLPRFNDKTLEQKAQPIDGRIVADLPSLDVLQGFVSDVRDVKGELHADLALGGTLGAPTVRGEAALRNGSASLPDLGVTFQELTLVARGDGTGPLLFEGSVRSGRGKLEVKGETPVTPGALAPTIVKLSGEDFEVVNQPPENRVLISPRLTVTLKRKRVDVEGELEIPEAKYEWISTFAAVRVSPDVVIVGKKLDEPADTGREIHARVRLILGDRVRLKASGLDARITGSVLAIETPGKKTIATGELEIRDATYKAYGQDLKVERGRLIFGGGPLDNPGIDARAYRRAKDGVVAGIEIRGTLRVPQTTVYSDPPMGQADALAYVLLGHPLGQSTQQEGSLLTNAAASLGLSGGNLLVKKLAARFGLDEARVESEGSFKEASLVVGKYLSPKLYVQYGIGIFTRASTLRVSYLLTRSWTIRAETGAANGADILYTIER